MEPDRFDDVELQMLEEPEVPRGPRRGTRWAIGIVATVLTAGAMAAGAWALTGSDEPPAPPPAKPAVHRMGSDASYRGDHPCHRGDRGASSSAASVRY